jgi:hypothetical protein
MNRQFNNYTSITTQTTTTVVSTSDLVYLHSIIAPKASGGTITLTDVASSPATYMVLPIGTIGTMLFDIVLPNGLKVVTSAGDTVLLTWSRG